MQRDQQRAHEDVEDREARPLQAMQAPEAQACVLPPLRFQRGACRALGFLCRSSSYGDAKHRRSNCGWRRGLGGRPTQNGKAQLVRRSVSISSAGRRWSRTISAFVVVVCLRAHAVLFGIVQW